MNNKGFTLIELMISVSLVSIVLIFTLNLLNDIRAEEDMGSNKTADLTNRTIITKVVQKDLDNLQIKEFGTTAAATINRSNICDMRDNELKNDYNLQRQKCIWMLMSDNTCRLIMIASDKGSSETKYFVYGKKNGVCARGPVSEWSLEKWELKSAVYKTIKIETTTIPQENNLNNNLSGDLANYLVMIKVPTELAPSYSNTSMNFDLEFIYYTTSIAFLKDAGTIGSNKDMQLKGAPFSFPE